MSQSQKWDSGGNLPGDLVSDLLEQNRVLRREIAQRDETILMLGLEAEAQVQSNSRMANLGETVFVEPGSVSSVSSFRMSQSYLKGTQHICDQAAYSFILMIESLENAGEGWPVLEISANPNEEYQRSPMTVSVVGPFSTGKSFVLGAILQKELPTGENLVTRGLSVATKTLRKKPIIGIDHAGFLVPLCVPEWWDKIYNLPSGARVGLQKDHDRVRQSLVETSLRDRAFVSELSVSLSNAVIVVLEKVDMADQAFLEVLKCLFRARAQQTFPWLGRRGDLFVVHNFRNVGHSGILEKCMREQIRSIAKGQFEEVTTSNGVCRYFREFDDIGTIHVAIANAGSPFGLEHNPPVFEFLRNSVVQIEQPVCRQAFVPRLLQALSRVLGRYGALEHPPTFHASGSLSFPSQVGKIVASIAQRPLDVLLGTDFSGENLLLGWTNRWLRFGDLRVDLDCGILSDGGICRGFLILADVPGLSRFEYVRRRESKKEWIERNRSSQNERVWGRMFQLRGREGVCLQFVRFRKRENGFILSAGERRSFGVAIRTVKIPRRFMNQDPREVANYITFENGTLRVHFPCPSDEFETT